MSEKLFNQEDLDRIVSERLARAKNEKAAELEKVYAELDALKAERAKNEAATQRAAAEKILSDNNIDVTMLDHLKFETLEELAAITNKMPKTAASGLKHDMPVNGENGGALRSVMLGE